MRKEGHKVGEYAIIELPVAQAGRFIRLPDKDGKNYLMYLDDVVRLLFTIDISWYEL